MSATVERMSATIVSAAVEGVSPAVMSATAKRMSTAVSTTAMAAATAVPMQKPSGARLPGPARKAMGPTPRIQALRIHPPPSGSKKEERESSHHDLLRL